MEKDEYLEEALTKARHEFEELQEEVVLKEVRKVFCVFAYGFMYIVSVIKHFFKMYIEFQMISNKMTI